MSVNLYLGCIIRTIYPEVEKAVKETLRGIGFEFEEPLEASCCAPFEFFSLSREAWLRLNERNISLFKSTVVTACDNCFASLSDTFKILSAKNRVNAPEVKPFEIILLERLRDMKLGFSFTGLRCAVQHSCHLLRPSRDVDDAENPRIVKTVLEMLGYLPVSYEGELDCCGGLVFEEEASRTMARRKAEAVERSGADCIVATCSHCMRQLRSVSMLPVLHLAQLSALSIGLSPWQVGVSETLVRRIVKR